jgi:hypothetical protein
LANLGPVHTPDLYTKVFFGQTMPYSCIVTTSRVCSDGRKGKRE